MRNTQQKILKNQSHSNTYRKTIPLLKETYKKNKLIQKSLIYFINRSQIKQTKNTLSKTHNKSNQEEYKTK